MKAAFRRLIPRMPSSRSLRQEENSQCIFTTSCWRVRLQKSRAKTQSRKEWAWRLCVFAGECSSRPLPALGRCHYKIAEAEQLGEAIAGVAAQQELAGHDESERLRKPKEKIHQSVNSQHQGNRARNQHGPEHGLEGGQRPIFHFQGPEAL